MSLLHDSGPDGLARELVDARIREVVRAEVASIVSPRSLPQTAVRPGSSDGLVLVTRDGIVDWEVPDVTQAELDAALDGKVDVAGDEMTGDLARAGAAGGVKSIGVKVTGDTLPRAEVGADASDQGRVVLGSGSARDWVLTRIAADVAQLGATDVIRCLVDPSNANDLGRKSWVEAQDDLRIPKSLLSDRAQMIGHDGTNVVALPAEKRHKIGTFTSTGTGNKAVSGVGFKPSLVMFEFIGGGSGATMVMGRGAMDAGGNQWVAIAAGDAGSGSRNAETNGCIGIPASTTASTYHTKAAFVSMDNDGFTINFGTHVSGTWTYAYTAFR